MAATASRPKNVANVNVTSPKQKQRAAASPPVQVLPRGAFPVGAGAPPGSPPVTGV